MPTEEILWPYESFLKSVQYRIETAGNPHHSALGPPGHKAHVEKMAPLVDALKDLEKAADNLFTATKKVGQAIMKVRMSDEYFRSSPDLLADVEIPEFQTLSQLILGLKQGDKPPSKRTIKDNALSIPYPEQVTDVFEQIRDLQKSRYVERIIASIFNWSWKVGVTWQRLMEGVDEDARITKTRKVDPLLQEMIQAILIIHKNNLFWGHRSLISLDEFRAKSTGSIYIAFPIVHFLFEDTVCCVNYIKKRNFTCGLKMSQ
jgi:hypothetical protein